MATEATAGDGASEGASNGVSGSFDADRAAFIAGIAGEVEAEDASKGDEAKSDDGDADLEEASTEKTEAEASDDDLDEEDDAKAEDDDRDLDDEDDEEEVDADTAKRIAKVKRTDQRLRERREADFKTRETAIQRTIEEWAPRIEKAERFEKLAERAKNPYEVADVLRELGLDEDDFEAASQAVFAHSKKFAADPKARETVARLKGDREMREELRELKKWREQREAAENEAAQVAEAERRVVAFVDTAAKSATDKTVLAADRIAANPEFARTQMAAVTARLLDETGTMPTPKQVIIEFEKSLRRDLRDRGIDPKTRIAELKAKAGKPSDKAKPASKATSKGTGKPGATTEEKPLTKEDFIRGTYD